MFGRGRNVVVIVFVLEGFDGEMTAREINDVDFDSDEDSRWLEEFWRQEFNGISRNK
jgi:hypothetical protein